MDQLRAFMQRIPRTGNGLSKLSDPLGFLRRTKTPKRQVRRVRLHGKKTRSIMEKTRAGQRESLEGKRKVLQFSLDGLLQPGNQTLFSVNGYDLITNADTWVFGELVLGAHAKVKGMIVKGHERLCTSIISSPR